MTLLETSATLLHDARRSLDRGRQRSLDRLERALAARHATSSPGAAGGAVEALRATWGRYPGDWSSDASLNLGARTLGEEWGGPAFADYIIELVGEYLGAERDVLELGCGGGKFSLRLAPKCRSLLCTDISSEMIEHTRAGFAARNTGQDVSFQVLNGVDFDGIAASSVDFIFSYDVMLHLQPQNVFSYLLDARRVLRENGVFMLHQINLSSPGGLTHFLQQYAGDTWKREFNDLRRRGHIYYMSADQMRTLANQAGLAVDTIFGDHQSFEGITDGRDLIGFLRKRPSRLDTTDGRPIELLVGAGQTTVYAVIDGERHAFTSAAQFERNGFKWESVRRVAEAELEAVPDTGPLDPWE